MLGLGEAVHALPPDQLISAILAAPVDLLWNGGIGTYVKASNQTHTDAGDRANDAVRIDAVQLRAKVVAEGGNLGLTQAARIEYAMAGGLVNTDFIDNSAGVDTSDHEVNIKILLTCTVGTCASWNGSTGSGGGWTRCRGTRRSPSAGRRGWG
jgi:glutamate dehydrogenase